MTWIRKNFIFLLLGALLVLNIFIWTFVFGTKPRDRVSVYFFDVGQGDSILIESTNRNRLLIDAGPNKKVLRELGSSMPLLSRSIDVLTESHPDKDHIAGFPEIINRYRVGLFLEPGVVSTNSLDDELKKRLDEKKVPKFLARAGQIIDMGDGSYFKVFFPDRDVSLLNTNDASIVMKYVYKDTCFLFMGDSPQKIEEYLVGIYGESLKCDVLKIGHHGSKTSTSEIFLRAVSPSYAIISAGKENSYGHPSKETLEKLKNQNVEILSTIDLGTIEFTSDGQTISVK